MPKLVQWVLDTDDLTNIRAYEAKMRELEARKDELSRRLAEAEEPPPLLRPSLAQSYRERTDHLSQALGGSDRRDAAAEVVRSSVSGIELTPENGRLAIVLRGDLAAMLSFAGSRKPGASSLDGRACRACAVA